MTEKITEPWLTLALHLQSFFDQIDDTRLNDLYRKLFAEGWNNRQFPLSTRNGESEIKYFVLEAVAIETIERREGRKPQILPGR